MATDREEFARIREVLKKNPRGMNVIEIAAAIDMHRQSVTKYLEMLMVAGQVEMRTFGPAKVYYLSQRLPLSAMLSISSDMIILLDRDLKIINANDAFLARMSAAREDILNKVIGSIYFPLEFQPSIIPFIADAILGKESRIEAVYRKKNKEQFFDVKFLPVVFDDGQPGATVIMEDVTGQRKAEREREKILARLKESDQSFRILIHNLRSGVVLVEASGRFSIYNPAFLLIFGLGEADMRSLNIDSPEWNSLLAFDKDGRELPPGERPSIKAFRTGKPVKNTLVGFRRRTDDRIIWALVNAEPLLSPDGRVDKLICTFYDITDRKLAEESLEKYRLFSENTRDIILFVDRDGRILEANEAAIRAYGYTMEELLALRIFDLRADPGPMVDGQMEAAFGKGILFETLHCRKDGTTFPVEVSSQGRMIGGRKVLLSVVRDVTERKRNEEELRKLSLSVEQSPATIVITDTKGNIEYVNPKFTRLTGYTPEEAMGKNPSILKSGLTPVQVYKEMWDTILSGKSWRGEFLNRKKNGELYYESAMISPVKNGLGETTHFMAIKEDITERKQMEQALRDREEQLRLRLSALLAPEGDICEKTLEEVLDLTELQESMDSLYDATGIGIWIVSLNGKILAGSGWQDICAKFHRCHPEASENCRESDLSLTEKQLTQGEYTAHRCKNGLWDIRTPIVVCGKHMANLCSGQFLYDDEPLDRAYFEAQAEKYGFDRSEYLAALDRVPRVSREKVRKTMGFYISFARMIARQSYSNARLAKALMEKK